MVARTRLNVTLYIVCLVIKFGPIVRPVDDISTSYYVISCRHEKRHGERAKFLVGVSLERNTLGSRATYSRVVKCFMVKVMRLLLKQHLWKM